MKPTTKLLASAALALLATVGTASSAQVSVSIDVVGTLKAVGGGIDYVIQMFKSADNQKVAYTGSEQVWH